MSVWQDVCGYHVGTRQVLQSGGGKRRRREQLPTVDQNKCVDGAIIAYQCEMCLYVSVAGCVRLSRRHSAGAAIWRREAVAARTTSDRRPEEMGRRSNDRRPV
ncbi:hypothetical protein O0L34_g9001 [Tuta absoluta]|nr:hypothetical protein O0L34_g9001 [Tuta absoluta]